jgi:hypothetical protein
MYAENKNDKMLIEFALIYSILINFLCNNMYVSLTLAGGLRLISLVRNSEAAGLQLLGPDKDALFIIRIISNFLSMLFPCSVITALRSYPAMFGFFNGEESLSNYESIKRNHYGALYLLLPCTTLWVNLTTQVYSNRMKKQMNDVSAIFVVYNADNVSVSSDTFSLSISHVVAIPVLILTTFFQSFANRKHRLYYLSPFYLFLVSVALPMLIILNSLKIQKFSKKKYTGLFPSTVSLLQNVANKCFPVKIGTIDNQSKTIHI